MLTLNHGLFLAMSLIWGATWIAGKVVVEAVPPIFMSGARYFLVSLLMAKTVMGLHRSLRGQDIRRIVLSGLLTTTATYVLLFWGIQYVPSGVASVVNLALMVLLLYLFAVLGGQERLSWRPLPAVALGIGGLLVLFWHQDAAIPSDPMELWGALAIVGATAAYALGSVLAKPLVGVIAPLDLTAAHAVLGMVTLGGLSLAFEPISTATFRSLLQPVPLAGLLFLVMFGTVVAYTIYLRLVRDWGAMRAGLYAFVSPVAALMLGTIVLGEPLGWRRDPGRRRDAGRRSLVAAATAAGLTMPAASRRTHA